MGERKVLNKYIPYDFDPKLVPRGKRPKDGLVPVRMMLPFSIQCATCNSFMYRGRKFNSKKEPMGGTDGRYLNIQRYRFYIKCTVCSRPVTFLTDPKNADYEMESGATRNYEVWHDKDKTNEEIGMEKEIEEKEDPMKALENRVLDSKREMDDLDNLDEIKAMNMRHLQIMSGNKDRRVPAGFDSSAKDVLDEREKKGNAYKQDPILEELNEHGLTAEEEDMLKNIKFGSGDASRKSENGGVKRLGEYDEHMHDMKRKKEEQMYMSKTKHSKEPDATAASPSLSARSSFAPAILTKKKRRVKQIKSHLKPDLRKQPHVESDDGGNALSGLLGAYGSSESE